MAIQMTDRAIAIDATQKATAEETGPLTVAREDLLRPIPKLSPRALVAILLIAIVYVWSINGTQADPEQLVKGVPNMVGFVVRLFPIDFDWRAVIKLPADVTLPFTINAAKFTDTLDGDPELQKVQSEIANSVPLDQAIASGQPMADPSAQTQADQAAKAQAVADAMKRSWVELKPSVWNRIWIPSIVPYVFQTLQMAIVGTTLAIVLALVFALLAARNTSPHPVVYQVTRFIMNVNRAIPELIVALIFVAAVGLGPFTGVLALGVASIGSLGRLYSEAIEQIDPQQVLAVRATGASRLQVFSFAVVPQVLPLMTSYSLVYFEHNVRAATVLGIVGAGGVGLALQQYIALFQFRELMGAVVILIIAVTIIDRISARVRMQLI